MCRNSGVEYACERILTKTPAVAEREPIALTYLRF